MEDEVRKRLRKVYDTEVGKELDVATLHETLTLLHTVRAPASSSPTPLAHGQRRRASR